MERFWRTVDGDSKGPDWYCEQTCQDNIKEILAAYCLSQQNKWTYRNELKFLLDISQIASSLVKCPISASYRYSYFKNGYNENLYFTISDGTHRVLGCRRAGIPIKVIVNGNVPESVYQKYGSLESCIASMREEGHLSESASRCLIEINKYIHRGQ